MKPHNRYPEKASADSSGVLHQRHDTEDHMLNSGRCTLEGLRNRLIKISMCSGTLVSSSSEQNVSYRLH